MSRCAEVWRYHDHALDATKVDVTRKDPETGKGCDVIYIFGRPVRLIPNREKMDARLGEMGLNEAVRGQLLDEIFGIPAEAAFARSKRIESLV